MFGKSPARMGTAGHSTWLQGDGALHAAKFFGHRRTCDNPSLAQVSYLAAALMIIPTTFVNGKSLEQMTNVHSKSDVMYYPIALGMTPTEARNAGGAFFFKVTADPTRWLKNADPYKVMAAQSQQPDNSQIWMTFKNAIQYPAEGEQTFRVHFRWGRAVKIEKLSPPPEGNQP